MASREEERVSRLLRAILKFLPIGAAIPLSEEFRIVLGILEQYVSATLAEVCPEWKQESLDAIYPLVARKSGEGEVEIFGLCIIISDQTTTPIHLRLQLSHSDDEVSWLVFRVGEGGEEGMLREKWRRGAVPKRLRALEGRAEMIDWAYAVTFGNRRSG